MNEICHIIWHHSWHTETVSPFHNNERRNSSSFFFIAREVASQLKMSVNEQSTKIKF
jgi:hypothetical protein